MAYDAKERYQAAQTLFRAFHYLLPRMRGGGLACPQPMNAEGLAVCILHNCMGRLLRELQQQRRCDTSSSAGATYGWIAITQQDAY